MIKAILNNEIVFLNEVPADTSIPPAQITEYGGKKYFNPSGAVIDQNVTDKLSPFHKRSGGEWIVDTSRKQEIIALLEKQVDTETDAAILTGFEYDGNKYYLSLENQMNFKALNDIRESLTYPVKVKHQAGYAEIASAENYHSFYLAGVAFIQLKIQSGWTRKDALRNNTTAELIDLLNLKS